jgi:hypothetical protein
MTWCLATPASMNEYQHNSSFDETAGYSAKLAALIFIIRHAELSRRN